jgi:hypothetical protein
MKRIIIAVLIGLLALPPAVFGADYYVNSSTGSNAAAGSAVAPWKDVAYADDKVAAGDTVNITAPATVPLRNVI